MAHWYRDTIGMIGTVLGPRARHFILSVLVQHRKTGNYPNMTEKK